MQVRSQRQFVAAGVAVALAMGCFAHCAMAKDDDQGADPAPAADARAAKKAPNKGKDPVATVFALPKGVVLTKKQQAAYDFLKASKEPELRDAIDDVQNAQGSGSTAQALKKLRECRTAIRTAINEILNGVSPDTGAALGTSGDGSGSGYVVPYSGYGPNYPGYNPYGYGGYPYGYGPRYPYRYKSSGGTSTGASGKVVNSPPVNKTVNSRPVNKTVNSQPVNRPVNRPVSPPSGRK